MSKKDPNAGTASVELAAKANGWWAEAATRANVCLAAFNPLAPLAERIAWALRVGLLVATMYSRFSSKLQHSTDDQVRECVVWAAQHGMYVPPELISVDEGVSGCRVRRDGLERMKGILKSRQASVLLVYKASRLFRHAHLGYQLIQEEVVDEGLRAVSVSQGIDTADKKTWKLQLQIHGVLDEMLLEAIGDHVRTSLTGMFLDGWPTGALGVCYEAKEVPDARPTKRGLPRTMPVVIPKVKQLVCENVGLHLEGMPLKQGWLRWLSEGGPCDPRSTTGRMSYPAYRRLLGNIRLTGRFEFGRKRNQFSSKRDYVRQIEQPDDVVAKMHFEELRILDDETYFRLQAWLRTRATGPRGSRKPKQLQLWDLTTEFFYCSQCSTPDNLVRFYQTGANGSAMQCKHGALCPSCSSVNRKEAVVAICMKLVELVRLDRELVESTVCRSVELDACGDDQLREQQLALQSRVRTLTHRVSDLYELLGQGSEDDRKEIKGQIRTVQAERDAVQAELQRVTAAQAGSVSQLTPEVVRETLDDLVTVLTSAGAGELGDECVYKALAVFRSLTGGRIMVHIERRPGRKRTNVRGVFQPQLLRALSERAGASVPAAEPHCDSVSVWLRQPPRLDAIAERVHQLIDVERKSFRAAAEILQREGCPVNSGNVWYSYRRWYEMQGLPVPQLPYNNGSSRRSA